MFGLSSLEMNRIEAVLGRISMRMLERPYRAVTYERGGQHWLQVGRSPTFLIGPNMTDDDIVRTTNTAFLQEIQKEGQESFLLDGHAIYDDSDVSLSELINVPENDGVILGATDEEVHDKSLQVLRRISMTSFFTRFWINIFRPYNSHPGLHRITADYRTKCRKTGFPVTITSKPIYYNWENITDTFIIDYAYNVYQGLLQHEAQESFLLDGKSLYNPHRCPILLKSFLEEKHTAKRR